MKIYKLYTGASIFSVLALTALTPLSLTAQPAPSKSPQPNKAPAPAPQPNKTPAPAPQPNKSPAIGAYIGLQPPSGSIAIQVGNFSFQYNNGVYYRPTTNGYVVAPAPRGAIIQTLPPGYTQVVSNGYVYYCYNNVYYRQAPNGYIVTEPPVTVVQQAPATVIASSTSAPINAEFSVWQGEQELVLRNGQFFRNTPEGLIWVEMPTGALTKSLPSSASVIWHKEIEYFEVDGVLFRKTPDGYKVVPPPWQ
jgi:hypothetical protein